MVCKDTAFDCEAPADFREDKHEVEIVENGKNYRVFIEAGGSVYGCVYECDECGEWQRFRFEVSSVRDVVYGITSILDDDGNEMPLDMKLSEKNLKELQDAAVILVESYAESEECSDDVLSEYY